MPDVFTLHPIAVDSVYSVSTVVSPLPMTAAIPATGSVLQACGRIHAPCHSRAPMDVFEGVV